MQCTWGKVVNGKEGIAAPFCLCRNGGGEAADQPTDRKTSRLWGTLSLGQILGFWERRSRQDVFGQILVFSQFVSQFIGLSQALGKVLGGGTQFRIEFGNFLPLFFLVQVAFQLERDFHINDGMDRLFASLQTIFAQAVAQIRLGATQKVLAWQLEKGIEGSTIATVKDVIQEHAVSLFLPCLALFAQRLLVARVVFLGEPDRVFFASSRVLVKDGSLGLVIEAYLLAAIGAGRADAAGGSRSVGASTGSAAD